MSAKPESQTPAGTTKKFGKGERHVPHPSAKAKRYYPAEEDPQPKKVRLTMEDESEPCIISDTSCASVRLLEHIARATTRKKLISEPRLTRLLL
jgi:hypothetical protein